MKAANQMKARLVFHSLGAIASVGRHRHVMVSQAGRQEVGRLPVPAGKSGAMWLDGSPRLRTSGATLTRNPRWTRTLSCSPSAASVPPPCSVNGWPGACACQPFFPAAVRDCRRPATRLARSGRDVRPPAVPTGIPGSGADPLRGQPDPAFQRMEGNRHRGAPNGDHRRALDLGRDRPGRPLPARLQLGNGPAVRHPDPGHRAHGDRSDAAGGPAQGRGGEHPALGRHRHRSHRRPAGGSGVQLHHLQRRRRWLATACRPSVE